MLDISFVRDITEPFVVICVASWSLLLVYQYLTVVL